MKLSNKVYDIVKHFTQIGLPAVAAFYAAIAHIWGLPYGSEVTATIAALVTLLSAVLGISSAVYNNKQEKIEDSVIEYFPKGE